MSDSLPVPVAQDDLALARRDVSAAIEAARQFLATPVFERQIPVGLLVKIATDDKAPIKERRRCAEVLARLQLDATRLLADLTGAREQRMKDLGLEAAPQEVNVTQVNQRIEIVREGAKDWRNVEGG